MAFKIADFVKETSTTTGTGSYTLAGAVAGFQGIVAGIGSGNQSLFAATDGTDWEIFYGTVSGTTLSRDIVEASSNAGAAVNWGAGTKEIYITPTSSISQMMLELDSDAADPPVPSYSSLKLWAKNRGGRLFLNMIGSSGLDTSLQPALFGNTVNMWLPGTGTTVAINFGTSFTARNSGTSAAQATPNLASTNFLTQMKRATFGTGTTATGASGIQSATTACWLGNAAGMGGFFFQARFGIETHQAAMRYFVGLSANNAAMAADSSGWNNTVGIGKDSADSNWQIITRGTAVTKTDTGCACTAGQVLDLFMFAPPNSSTVYARVVDPQTGTVYVNNVAFSTNLPSNTTFLYMQAHCQSTSGTTAKLLALNKMYLETDT